MTDSDCLPPGTQIDSFKLDERLGADDFTITYFARNQHTERDVVITEYFPRKLAARSRDNLSTKPKQSNCAHEYEHGLSDFLQTARAWSQLHDANVVRVTRYMEANGTGYIVMDYEQGQTLEHYLQARSTPLSGDEIRQLLVPLLNGLREIHGAGLIHGNIKPDTVFLRRDAPPLLVDFSTTQQALRTHSRMPGRPEVRAFVPVEQYSPSAEITPASDLYALGATVYRCLAGALPVDAPKRVAANSAGQQDPLLPALEIGRGNCSPALLGTIDWMLKPLAKDRPKSVDELLGLLSSTAIPRPVKIANAVNDGRQSPAAKPTPPALESGISNHNESEENRARRPRTRPTPHRPRRTHRLRWAIGLAATVAITGIVLWEPPKQNNTAQRLHPNTADATTAGTQDQQTTETNAKDLNSAEITRPSDAQRAAKYRALEKQEEERIRKAELQKAIAEQVAAQVAELKVEIAQQEEERVRREQEQHDSKIQQLLVAAEDAINNERLITPPEDNALMHLHAVQVLDPGNVVAQLALDRIANKYIEFAKTSLSEGNLEQARTFLQIVAVIRPDHEQIRIQRDELARHEAELEQERAQALLAEQQAQQQLQEQQQQEREQQAAQQQATAEIEQEESQAEQQKEIERLLTAANQAYAAGRWTVPSGNNALQFYRSVLALDAANALAKEGISGIAKRYLQLANEAIVENKLSEAEAYIAAATAVDPGSDAIALLRNQIDARKQREPTQQSAEPEQSEQLVASTAVENPESQYLAAAINAYYAADYETAFRLLKPLAENGNDRAQFRLAVLYSTGRGVERDPVAAEQWLAKAAPTVRQAAADGRAWAQADLAAMYKQGWIVSRSYETAAQWYQRAAEQGDPGAQNNLGIMYEQGLGVKKDRVRAVDWLRKAAAQQHQVAKINLQKLGYE